MPDRKPPRVETEGWDPFGNDEIFEPEPFVPLAERLRRQQQRFHKWLIRGAVAAVALLVFIVVWNLFNPIGPPTDTVEVSVPAGASTGEVGSLLAGKGVVPNGFTFRVWAKLTGGVTFQSGKYNFQKHSSAGEAIAVLKNGPKAPVQSITIPEGFRLAQIAQRVGDIPGMSASRFLEVAASGKVRSNYQPQNIITLEGFLFPDTYAIGDDDDEESLLRRMVAEFDTQGRKIGLDNASTIIGHSPYETLVIASLVEAEAKTPDDRGKISKVIENRLFKNMPLQIDATVLYALDNRKTTLSNSDLKINSVYNTYKNLGLPPAPIGNPGLASLNAALHPTDGEWLYYVLIDEQGNHAFANTFEEHQQNIATAKSRGVIK
jgi:UPF0755 protein